MALIHLAKENFHDLIQNNDVVVVDFFATWCGPCKMLSPVFEATAQKHDTITWVKIDVDQHQEIAQKYRVKTIPNVSLFKKGELVNSHIGYLSEDDLVSFVQQ